MHYEVVLWDFNGTLLDDVQIGIDAENAMLARRGMPLLTLERYREVFDLPIIRYYRSLGYDFDREPYEQLAVEWVREYESRESRAPLHDGILAALQAFAEAGCRQVVLSASEHNMLCRQLLDLGIRSFFDEVIGVDNIEAHGKIGVAREWMSRQSACRAALIGDTLHDCEVAKELGVDCLLFSGGHQTRARLLQAGVPVCDTMEQIRSYLLSDSAH